MTLILMELKKQLLLLKRLIILHSNISFFEFKVSGWIGEHEKAHLNGVITNLDLQKLSDDNIDIYKFRKL